jgi:hypothetical protein
MHRQLWPEEGGLADGSRGRGGLESRRHDVLPGTHHLCARHGEGANVYADEK